MVSRIQCQTELTDSYRCVIMHYEILDDARRSLLPFFAAFKNRFYLAGGTALALQIGHRDSVDFDFFAPDSIDTNALFAECSNLFTGRVIVKTQEEKNTLGILVDGVQITHMSFPYPLVSDLVVEPNISLASLEDIACMKFSAITSRSAMKDYIDIFFLLKEFALSELLEKTAQKFPSLDQNLILKSLVYFDDIIPEPIKFTPGNEVSFDDIRSKLSTTVAMYLRR